MIENRNTIVVIPARMASARLPGKPLADLGGLPMIVHVWRRALEANVGQVLVAAAEAEIANAVRAQGGDAIVTTPGLPSGSDRIAEALRLRDPQGEFRYVLNLQGDLPLIDALSVQRCLAGLGNEAADISTIAAPLSDPVALADPNVVKVITPLSDEREVAFARDFTRHLAPDTPPPHWHHIGVYAYKRAALERFVALPVSAREAERRLEQMRALDNGMRIAVVRVDSAPQEVNTAQDLAAARHILRTRS
jgi:3-deoxy-manno-octulosonate cytidylyltransferase (CMP-KDO synthetase)